MEIKTIDEFNKIITEPKVTVVDFYANWCGPCKMLAPIFSEVEKSMPNVNFVKVDIDQLNEIASVYDIQSIPTLVFIKDGTIIDKHTGFIDAENLIKKINEIN